MKVQSLTYTLGFFLFISTFMIYYSFQTPTTTINKTNKITNKNNPSEGQVKHIVAFRYAQNVTKTEKDFIMSSYFSLKEKCVNTTTNQPYILSFDGGYPNSPEGFDQHMEQIYIVTFRNVEDRNYFVGRPFHFPFDPAHDAFKNLVGKYLRMPISEGLIVMDFNVLNKP
ncbi:hypothetical protein ABK040_016472 [Willaertia magna]